MPRNKTKKHKHKHKKGQNSEVDPGESSDYTLTMEDAELLEEFTNNDPYRPSANPRKPWLVPRRPFKTNSR